MTMLAAAAAVPFLFAAAQDVQPRPGVQLTGAIQFPRPQAMTVETHPADGNRLTVRLGFDGRCRGGGLGEIWSSNVLARPVVRVRKGRFDARLRGSIRGIGGVADRRAEFTWRFSGRFLNRDSARAKVSGSAIVRAGNGRVISRCSIARPASVRLAR